MLAEIKERITAGNKAYGRICQRRRKQGRYFLLQFRLPDNLKVQTKINSVIEIAS